MRVFNTSARPFVVVTPRGHLVIPARAAGDIPEGTPNTSELAEAFRQRTLVRRETSDSAVREAPAAPTSPPSVLEDPQADLPADDSTPETLPTQEHPPELETPEGVEPPAPRRRRSASTRS